MHFLLVSRRLVYWMGTLCWIFLFSGNVYGRIDVQNWLDSLTSLVENYSEFASRIALKREIETEAVADVEFDDLDRQREEARIDCLANRLLAEEYQPYDFDIRETMWCKGWMGNSISSSAAEFSDDVASEPMAESVSIDIESEVPFVGIQPSVPIFPENRWLNSIRSQVVLGFKAQLQSDWKWALDHAEYFADRVLVVVAAIEEKRMVSRIASMPALRDVFGRSVLPYQVAVTPEEYATIAIQLWNELRANAAESGILNRTLGILGNRQG